MNELSSGRVYKNYLLNVSYQILAIILPLITTPYISRVLGAENIGIYSFTTSIATYFYLAAILGSSTYGQREIAYHRDDPHERSRTFWEVVLLRIVTTVVVLSAYALLIGFISENRTLFWIQALMIVSVITDVSWFFSGLEVFSVLVFRNACIKLAGLAFIFLTVKGPEDLWLYIFGTLLINLLGYLSLWPYLRKYLCKIPVKELRPFRHFKVTIRLFLPTIAVQVYTILDKTMIGLITDSAAQNGYYEQAEKVVKILLTLLTAMGSVMAPRISYLHANQDKETITVYLKKVYRFVFLLSIPMCLGLAITAKQFVPWFFGDGYDAVIPLLPIFSVLIVVIGMSNISGTQYLVSVGREKAFTVSVVCGAIVNFILNLLLIGRLEALGAAIASVIAEVTVTTVQLYYIRDVISLKQLWQSAKPYLFSGTVMLVICLIFQAITPASIVGLLVTAGAGVIVYFAVLLLIKDEFLLATVSSLKEKLIKRK